MSNISGQLIKDSYNYVLQSDLISGIVYRIGGSVAENPKFISGLTVNANFTYSDGSEFPGYVLTCDAAGNAIWGPVSGATSGVVVTGGTFDYSAGTLTLVLSNGVNVPISGLEDIYVTGGVVSGNSIVFSYNDTNTFEVSGITSFNTFTSYTASTEQIINSKVDINTFNSEVESLEIEIDNRVQTPTFTAYTATTQPLILNSVTGGTYSGGTLYLINNSGTTIPISGFTTGGTSTTDTFVTGFSLNNETITLSQNRIDQYSAFNISLSGYVTNNVFSSYTATTQSTIDNKLDTSGFTAYTASTETTINNKLDTSGFTAYTATTQPLILNSVTGGTFSGGTLYLINNSGSTIPISGFTTGGTSTTDTFVTGFSLNSNVITLSQNRTDSYSSFTISLSAYTGSSVSGAYLPLSGGTVTGNTTFTSGLTVNYIDFDTTPNVLAPTGGTVYFDSNENALSYKPITPSNDVTVNLGQESLIRIYNNLGFQINNGQVLHVTGATLGVPTVSLAVGTGGDSVQFQISGIATHDIPDSSFGFMTVFGIVRDINLTGFTVGEQIYLSQTVPGGLASYSDLSFTGRTCEVGHVLDNSALGKLQVSILNEIEGTIITTQENNILAANNSSTGIFNFSGLSITTPSGTTFNVGPVEGWIIDNVTEPANPTIRLIIYPGSTGNTALYVSSATETYILLTSGLTLTQQTTFPTPQQRRQNLYLGKFGHANRQYLINAFNEPDSSLSPVSQLRDILTPIRLINGGIYPSANGNSLTFNTSGGVLYGLGIGYITNKLDPNSLSVSGTSPCTFQYRTQTGGTASNTTLITPEVYDNNGVLTAVGGGSNSSTNQRIYLVQNGQFRIQYGQQVYGSLADAIAASQSEAFTTFSNFRDNAILIGILSVNKNATNLSDITQARFLLTSKFGETVGSAGGISTTNLQQAYNNSSTPEIVTNSAEGALTIQNGAGTADNVTNLFEGKGSSAGPLSGTTSFIRADGLISGSSVSTPGFTANTGGLTALTISATTYLNLPSATFTGGTVSGPTNFTGGLTANTISATTFSGNGSGLTNVQNIYNSDGTISSDRYVSISGNTLWFSGLANGFQVIINDGIIKPGFTILSDSLGGPSFRATYDGSVIIDGPAEFYNTALFNSTVSMINLSPDNTSPYLLGLNNSSEVTTLDSDLLFNSITGGTYSGGTLSLINNSGGTVSISGFSTGSSFTGGTVSGPTNFTSGLTANTISATTYQNLPATPFLPLTGGTITGNVVINTPISTNNTALNVISQNTSQSIALRGLAGKGTNAYGVYCDVSPTDEFNFITNGIGGYFEVGGQFGYGAPDNKYSLQLKDDTEGVGKVLTCVTSDGKANWRDTINVSAVTATTITSNSVKVLPVALTVISNTASTNASLSSLFTLTLTGNTTLATPTNGFSGQRIVYRLRQDGTGNKLLTLSSGFRSGPITVTLSTAANTTDYLGVIYNEIDNKWDVLALNKGYS